MRVRTAAAIALIAAPVAAQDTAPEPVPEFDGMAEFEVIGTTENRAANLLVSQGGEIFGCNLSIQMDAQAVATEIVVKTCVPVITEARRAASDAAAEDAERQAAETARGAQQARAADQISALRASVEELDDVYGVALRVAYLEEGCRLDRSEDARVDAFFDRMDAIAAEEAARIGATLPAAGEALDEAYGPAYDEVGNRIVVLDDVETFVGLCEGPVARQVVIDTLGDRGCTLTFDESDAFQQTVVAETERRIAADGGEMLGTAAEREMLLWPALFDDLIEEGVIAVDPETNVLSLVEGCAP